MHVYDKAVIMKLIAIITLLACNFSLTESAAESDCTVCKTNYDDSTSCAKIKTYMSCMIDTYQKDNALAGCSDIKTGMNTAKGDYGTADCATTAPATGSCLCEVAYYQSTLDCPAIKTKLTCLFAATDVGCDGSKTNRELITAAKVVGDAIKDCLTDTCKCEAIYQASDLATDTPKCTAVKAELVCLFPASGSGCDDSTTNIAVVTAAKGVGKAIDPCITDTCECEAIYNEADVSAVADKCIKLKEEMHCLVKSDGVGCDGTTRSAVATATDGLILNSVDNCRTGLTDTCKCAIAYAKTDTTKKAEKCKTATTAQTCLKKISGVTDLACDKVTTTEKYLNETFIPIITEACGGTSLLLSTSVAMGCLLIVFEMFH